MHVEMRHPDAMKGKFFFTLRKVSGRRFSATGLGFQTQLDKDLGIWCDTAGSWTSPPKLSSNLSYSIVLENTIYFLLQENNTIGLYIH